MAESARECRHWLGDRPCDRSSTCSAKCPSYDPRNSVVLLVHLGALGAVVRSTSLLAPIRRKHPNARIFWLTESPAHRLLVPHPEIDRVVTTEFNQVCQLFPIEFEAIYVVDKSAKAAGLAQALRAQSRFGFGMDEQGKLTTFNPEAEGLLRLGLDNHEKFFINSQPETQLVCESLALTYRRDPYHLPLTAREHQESSRRHMTWARNPQQPVIGFNTGCSSTIAAKKWTVEFHREVLQSLLQAGFTNLVLLGGREDDLRNQRIAWGLPVVQSPTDAGLRDGLVSVGACDIVITGDSLGMHMAIALQKQVVAWFGPTCAHEIDLFDRGQKILSQASCSPCWKRSCDKPIMCYDQVKIEQIHHAIEMSRRAWEKKLLSSKPLSSETSSSPDLS